MLYKSIQEELKVLVYICLGRRERSLGLGLDFRFFCTLNTTDFKTNLSSFSAHNPIADR